MAAAIDLTNTTRPPWSLSAVRRGTYSRERSAPAVSGNGTAGLGIAPPIVREVLNSPGRPLDRSKSAYFSGLYGFDFRDLVYSKMRRQPRRQKRWTTSTPSATMSFRPGRILAQLRIRTAASRSRADARGATKLTPILRRQPNSQSPQVKISTLRCRSSSMGRQQSKRKRLLSSCWYRTS